MRNIKLACLFLTLLIAGVGCNDDDQFNQVPVAEAGPVQTITLPANTVTLTGSGSDVDGTVVAYLWSQVSGPASSDIRNPGNSSTIVTFTTAGTYKFQLMVTDNDGATGVDTTSINVNQGATQTVTLQPASNPTEFVVGISNGANLTYVGNTDIPIETWTSGGNPLTLRSFLKFNLSSIPQSATIVSANLYLYSYPSPTANGNFTDANFGTNNAMTLQRVAADWSPGTISWFNQPAGASQGQLSIPHTALSTLDLNLDVTNLVSSMVANNNNYGFLIKLQNEVALTSRIFVSSGNNTYPAKRPKLVILYQ